jgi:hypothetical protein
VRRLVGADHNVAGGEAAIVEAGVHTTVGADAYRVKVLPKWTTGSSGEQHLSQRDPAGGLDAADRIGGRLDGGSMSLPNQISSRS